MGVVLLNSWTVLQFIVLSFSMWKDVLGSLGVAESLPVRGKLWTLSSFILTHAVIIVLLSRNVWHCLTSCLFLGGSKLSSDLFCLLCSICVFQQSLLTSPVVVVGTAGLNHSHSVILSGPLWVWKSGRLMCLWSRKSVDHSCICLYEGGFSWLEFPGLVLLLLLKMSTAELFTC